MEVNRGLDGVLNVNKPSGWTSHDVVLKIRHATGESKAGHTGTLDPLATGVLLVCLGRATKIAQFLIHEEKEYVATLKLGITTDTFDADGTVLDTKEVKVTPRKVKHVLSAFRGEIEQIPPMFSAVKQGGERLYRLARRGQTIDRASRKVFISGLDLMEATQDEVRIRVRCSKGTYIRALASDIGAKLGCGAHVAALQRTRVGRFRLEKSLPPEKVALFARTGALQKHILSISDVLSTFPEVRVNAEDKRRLANGASVVWQGGVDVPVRSNRGKTIRIMDSDNAFVGLGTVEWSKSETKYDLKPLRIFV